MKILHVIHSLDLKSGGPSHALYALTKAQLKLGLQPHIFSTDRQAGNPWKPRQTYIDQVKALFPEDIGSINILPAFGKKKPWVRYGYSFSCRSTLRKFLTHEDTRPSFVHIHGLFSQITSVAASLSYQLGIPHAIRLTGALNPVPLSMGSSYLKQQYLKYSLKHALEKASFVHTTSEPEAETVSQYVHSSRIKIIPLGIEMPTVEPETAAQGFRAILPSLNNNPFILCMSRIHPIKNLELALRSFSELTRLNPSLHIVIAGEANDHQKQIVQVANELGLLDKTHFPGFLEDQLKSGAYYAASCFLQTSFHENFGVSILESLAHGLKVISTPGVASARYLKPAAAGEIAQENPKDIASAIHRVTEGGCSSRNPQIQQWVAQEMSWDTIAIKLQTIYTDYASI